MIDEIRYPLLIIMIKTVLMVILVLGVLAEKDYSSAVLKLKESISNPQGNYYHKAFERLANFSDSFGPRLWGSEILQMAINNLTQQAHAEGFDNVRLEPVPNFTNWVRGAETLTLHSPRPDPWPLKVIGLGWSVPCNVKARAIVVKNWDELESRRSEVQGKIVVFDEPWVDYDTTVSYRALGASNAAKYGAVATLVRSVTPDSIESVHAGAMKYNPNLPKICAAAIAIEDADMFRRMQTRGQSIVLALNLESRNSTANSHNLVFEIKGSTFPEQVLLMGGHIDSWDTGSQTGANDDGGGFMTVFEALRLIKGNGLVPKRTLRFIAWSGEEFGAPDNGAQQYAKLHTSELKDHIVAFESDYGSSKLLGFGIEGSKQGKELLRNITTQYLSLINVTVANDAGEAADIYPLFQKGVPMMANVVQDTPDGRFYFSYHHTGGDSMTIMSPDDMDSNVLGMAALFYILADLDVTIQSDNPPR